MGIRFEYGSRKATNGPMIFFSDPVSEVNLQEEIRGAIESRLSFYAYHFPGDMMMSFGSSEGTVEGFGLPGFVISSFLPDGKTYTIPYSPTPRNNSQEQYAFPETSTSLSEYYDEIEAIQNFIAGDEDKKVVAARILVDHLKIDIAATFLSLSKAYPDAYTFCFSTPQTGCWIGASPELLLSNRCSNFKTMALAGTRSKGSDHTWDSKNEKEQQMVVDYIEKCLSANGLEVAIEDKYTRSAGKIEHICTPIKAFSKDKLSGLQIEHLLHSLSPTPATAGVPKKDAIRIITATEKFERAFYGGFSGPFRNSEEFTFFVNLRCGRIESERVALFAGGGITAYSKKEDEWRETEMKLTTLKDLLQPDSSPAL